MTTLNIPSSPSQGETYEANGVVYTWDGSKWTAATGSGGGGDATGVGADAWGDVKGSSGNLNGGYNCTASKNSTGNYRVTFLTSMPNTSYGIVFGMGKIQKSINFQNKTTAGFDVETKDISTNVAEDRDFAFTVHASSTVTPTYTWTRDGTTLKPANDGDSIEAGAATFAGTVLSGNIASDNSTSYARLRPADGVTTYNTTGTATDKVYKSFSNVGGSLAETISFTAGGSATFSGNTLVGNFDLSESNTSGVRVLASGGLQLQRDSAASNSPRFEIIRGTGDKTVVINSDGSAKFAGDVDVGGSPVSGSNPGVKIHNNGSITVARPDTGNINNDPLWLGYESPINAITSRILSNGNATFANTFFNLEADDDTKYTATTDADGNESLVYNGAVLDVKELLLKLVTAADRIETLEAKVATLESDHTTLMNNNNGGY